MADIYSQTVEKICRVSEEMLMHSRQGDWEDVVSLEEKRQQLLDQLAQIDLQEFVPTAEELLQKIIAINSDIEKLSRHEMEACRQGCIEVINKKSAIDAYSLY